MKLAGSLDDSTALDLRAAAQKAATMAYSPYSGIRVGAAILTRANRVYLGCNVENASYGLTICAERAAVFKAVSEEGSGMSPLAVALFSDDARVKSPCGACRQVIAEFSDDVVVLLPGGVATDIAALLPAGFTLQ